ncbi:hypothetical protein EDEG_03246 [Edhazardia aedis USNM 41457]|uniref:Uncharacterized protein n=1 Tax=Edhazardia aedis (strain USNM 41457) TaxID=1003232 RepID=J8ZRJ0_EDHAE|nr:hypothetical protein EDEG_03246 [Edhazardia aedis USNM 41457]|eukprot:EJW02313.1 hypothetical protein EDEG_03246 [Edhazardia aedis USNM 41457]
MGVKKLKNNKNHTRKPWTLVLIESNMALKFYNTSDFQNKDNNTCINIPKKHNKEILKNKNNFCSNINFVDRKINSIRKNKIKYIIISKNKLVKNKLSITELY